MSSEVPDEQRELMALTDAEMSELNQLSADINKFGEPKGEDAAIDIKQLVIDQLGASATTKHAGPRYVYNKALVNFLEPNADDDMLECGVVAQRVAYALRGKNFDTATESLNDPGPQLAVAERRFLAYTVRQAIAARPEEWQQVSTASALISANLTAQELSTTIICLVWHWMDMRANNQPELPTYDEYLSKKQKHFDWDNVFTDAELGLLAHNLDGLDAVASSNPAQQDGNGEANVDNLPLEPTGQADSPTTPEQPVVPKPAIEIPKKVGEVSLESFFNPEELARMEKIVTDYVNEEQPVEPAKNTKPETVASGETASQIDEVLNQPIIDRINMAVAADIQTEKSVITTLIGNLGYEITPERTLLTSKARHVAYFAGKYNFIEISWAVNNHSNTQKRTKEQWTDYRREAFDYVSQPDNRELKLWLETYIRAVVDDVGERLYAFEIGCIFLKQIHDYQADKDKKAADKAHEEAKVKMDDAIVARLVSEFDEFWASQDTDTNPPD